MISKTGTHAMLALAFMSKLKPGEYAGASQIADEISAPRNYLGKLLQQLAETGLLESQKGFGGGFRLAYPASKIALYDVLEPLERVSKWNGCFLGKPTCRPDAPCRMHKRWSKIRADYLRFLKATTIAEIS